MLYMCMCVVFNKKNVDKNHCDNNEIYEGWIWIFAHEKFTSLYTQCDDKLINIINSVRSMKSFMNLSEWAYFIVFAGISNISIKNSITFCKKEKKKQESRE